MYGYFDSEGRTPNPYRYFSGSGAPELTPEQKNALLEQVQGRGLQAAEMLLAGLDVPASWVRDFAAGEPIGSGTTPAQLLDAAGLDPGPAALGGWGRPLAEFATGALLDPLNAVAIGGVGRAGRAARGVTTAAGTNLLDDAQRVMSRRLIDSGSLDSDYARSALDSFSTNFNKGARDLTDADLLARPLAGPRSSRRGLTLRDVVEDRSLLDPATGGFAPRRPRADSDALRQAIEDQGFNYQAIADEPLRQDIGIGLPFTENNLIGTNLPGGEWLASGLDRVGQAVRWSGPGRHAYASFDKDVYGATEEAGQIIGKEVSAGVRQADAASARFIADRLSRLEPDLPRRRDLQQAMRRILDGFPDPADTDLITPGSATYRPDLAEFVNEWRRPGGMRDDFLARRREMGLASTAYKDPFGGDYFPSHVDDLSFMDKILRENMLGKRSGGSGRRGRAFSSMTGDQLARSEALKVPGGRDTINRLSLDANVAGPNRVLNTDDDAARYIKSFVDAESARRFPAGVTPSGAPVPEYTLRYAKKLARILRELDPHSIEQGLPMFGASFIEDFARYARGNIRAASIADTAFDLLAGSATPLKAGAVPRGGAITLANAAKRLGLRTVKTQTAGGTVREGAAQQLLARLAQRFPGAPELSNFSIDARMVDRLTRIADFYDYPEVQRGWLKWFDDVTRVWKGSILAWPARFTRDWLSGAFSNAVEVGVGPTLWEGYTAARYLVQGEWDELDRVIARMPRYQRMAAATRRREFQKDMASGGLLGGRRAADMAEAVDAVQTGEDVINEFLPGMNPRTTIGYQAWDMLTGKAPLGADSAAYSELFKGWNRSDLLAAGMRRPRDVRNPILKWSQKLGDTTDTINRASGYMALLLKGIDPMEAARRMKMAHVDYSSLTTFERTTIRRFLPFWSYTSRIGKWVASKMLERPGGRFTQFGLRAPQAVLDSGDEYTPESIRSSYGAPVSPELSNLGSFLGSGKASVRPGVSTWLTDIDLPGIDQINMFRPGFDPEGNPSLLGTLWNTTREITGKQLHVAPRILAEQIIGENLYTGRPTREFTPVLSEIAYDALGIPPESPYGDVIKRAAPFVDLVPFVSRPLQIANRLMDADKVPDFRDRLWQMAVNATAGVKFQNVSDEARAIDARKNIGEMLEQDPLIRTFRTPYLPERAIPYADPNLLLMMALERDLGRDLAAAKALRTGSPQRSKASSRMRNTDPYDYFQ